MTTDVAPAHTITDIGARAEFIAAQIKKSQRVDLPVNSHWNYGPCERHEEAKSDCEYRACGGDLFDHQSVTTAWLCFQKKALVASSPGTGKTNSLIMLLCILKEQKQLGKAILVINTPAVLQWAKEMERFAPGLNIAVVAPGLTKKARVGIYSSNFDVLLVGHHMMLRDEEILVRLRADFFAFDDVDPLANHKTKVHKAACRLADASDRTVVMNASAVATKLTQLHGSMAPLGGRYIWGSLPMFERRFLLREWDEIRVPTVAEKAGKIIRGHEIRNVARTVGIQNGDELRQRLEKWYIRYTYDDLGNDLKMPELMPPTNVWLDLYPKQRAKYEELRKGVLEIQRKEGVDVRHVTALSAFSAGGQICAGLAALGEEDGPGTSVKLDWVVDKATGEWAQQKIVVFAKNIGTIQALQNRLTNVGVGYATVWGEDASPEARAAEVSRFWEDPNCRVFMGTAAIERSLNLQVANIVVNVDMHLNPERVKQILGRIRRAGSSHSHVYTFNLFATDTQESGYMDVLRKREAVTSFVWDDEETVFEKLSAQDLLRLIRP